MAATARLEYASSDSSSDLRPFIVHFTNANLKHGREKKRKRKIKFACYQWADQADARKKQRRTLVAETDQMEYIGHNHGEFSGPNTMCKYILGVYNSNTEVMKMYDTEMITLQPKVLVDAVKTHAEEDQESKVDLSFAEKSDLLTEAFGSSKRKRAMASRLKNKVDKTNLGSAVSDMVQALSSETLDKKDGVSEQQSYIPPFNSSAVTAADVYKLEDIISPLEFEVLQQTSSELKDANRAKVREWRDQKRFPEYILRHLEVMSVNPTQRLHQSCCLLYLSYMIRLYRLNYQELRRKDPLQGMPEVIQDELLSAFSLQKGRFRAVPKRLKDKLVCYMLVLALIIDEFTLECDVIAKDLGMAESRLTTYLKAVGCVVKSSKGQRKLLGDDKQSSLPKKTASLEIPLPLDFQNLLGR